MGPEQKLYRKLKDKTPKIIWNRVENISVVGMPDLLGYNTNYHFFTVELKVTKGKKIKFSPHQIAFHVHTLRIVLSWSRPSVQGPGIVFKCFVVQESRSLMLAAWSLTLVAWGLNLSVIFYISLELDAWSLVLGARPVWLGRLGLGA